MTEAIKPLNPEQSKGANPGQSAWVTASAGTGKTQVLTARLLRLLLSGAEPGAILAITFTKAAAAEMASRIRERLAAWVTMKDEALKKELWAIRLPDFDDPAQLRRARTLFAKVIDAPGAGLAIQTIHSFCQSLLTAFPEEAGLAPGFRPLEDDEARRLLRETLMQCIADAPGAGELGFLDRVTRLALRRGEQGAATYLYACARATDALETLPAGLGPWARSQFGLPQHEAPQNWMEVQCANNPAVEDQLRAVEAALRAWRTAKTAIAAADVIADWLYADAANRAQHIDECALALLTKEGALRAHFEPGKQCGDAHLAALAASEWLTFVRDTAAQMDMADALADALDAGRHFARAYAGRKRREGFVDFDDLISRTALLLGSSDDRDWIKYKLDQRIDHLLLDEAQDTNAQQWAIVKGLVDEYFSGEGARADVSRTMFVVGDTKQAIYGFQGTSPQFFNASRHRYAGLAAAAQMPLAELSIAVNFRSSPPVLAVVDHVIATVGPAQFGLDDTAVRHLAHATEAPGRVSLWPLEPADAVDGDGADDSGADADGDVDEADGAAWIDNATRRLADKIARTVRSWVDDGMDGVPVQPGDVLILCRRRSGLASLIVSRLQVRGVPVAGVDRLGLNAPLAVQDLMAAARFALQPLDSLNLAALLVSPIMGWSHEDVLRHGWRLNTDGKEAMPLWSHLNRQEALRNRLEPLYAILAMAGYASPYRFFEQILSGPVEARRKILARLGADSLDPLEELLSQALAFETREGGSLHQFVRWFDGGERVIQRQLDAPMNEVRVMTVHGSKGLQGKIVILADAAHDPLAGRSPDAVMWQTEDGDKVPILPVSKGSARPSAYTDQLEAEKVEALRESWRLLYVAMTRAERMLFVAGALNKKAKEGQPPEQSWYAALSGAMAAMGATTHDDAIWGQDLRMAGGGKGRAKVQAGRAVALPAEPLPLWVNRPPPTEARPRKPLSPSVSEDQAVMAVPQPPSPDDGTAQRRGILMHALFERLPAVPVDARTTAAEQWLAARAPDFAADARAAMVSDVLRVMHHPDFARLFGPDSLAEVPFSALVDGRVIAGTVDRLRVTDAHVDIIDFKSGKFVPADEGAVQPAYLRQMAAYVAAMQVIFPGRTVTAALLFSAGPRLISLSSAVIDANKPALAD